MAHAGLGKIRDREEQGVELTRLEMPRGNRHCAADNHVARLDPQPRSRDCPSLRQCREDCGKREQENWEKCASTVSDETEPPVAK